MKLIPFLAGLLALACAPLAHAAPMRAADFVDSIGVGTHLTQQSVYYDARKVQGALAYLGVRHLRDAAPDPRSPYPAVFGAYAAAGYDFTLTGSGYSTAAQADVQAAAFQAAHPGAIVALEGYNEPNNWKQPSGGWYGAQANTHAGAAAYTRELMTGAVSLPGVAVLNASDEPPPACAGSAVNVHSYGKFSASQASPQIGYPQPTLWYDLQRYKKACPGQPVWVTETGYATAHDVNSVSEAVQAEYLLQTLAYEAQQGVVRTYLYELLDEQTGSSDSEKNYGLFHSDGTPKPAATYVHNLIGFLADKGGSAAAQSLTVTFADPAVKQLLLTKGDGSYVLLFWREANRWDGKAGRAVQPPTVHDTFKLSAPRSLTSLRIHDGSTRAIGRGADWTWDWAGDMAAVSISAN